MTAKTSPARRRAFFAALEATGNHSIAAARARVSIGWVKLHKRDDPPFRAACDAALAVAAGRLGGAAEMRPAPGYRHLDGEELVIRDAKAGRPKLVRSSPRQWTAATERIFLNRLAATANVKLACAEVGLTDVSAYAHKKRWPSFAERWARALDAGYARIEAELVRSGANSLDVAPIDPDEGVERMSVDAALHLMRIHSAEVRGVGLRRGAKLRKELPVEEVRAEVLRIIERVRRVSKAPGAPPRLKGGEGRGGEGARER